MEKMFAMIDYHGRNPREELLFNSGRSVQKTLYSISPEATPEQIKDILLRNHSNLKTPSQHTFAFQSIQQKPDEALQTYNTRYESYYQLAHPGLDIDNDTSRVSCIHYANSLHGKLGEEMEGRFNQELPDNLWAAFKKASRKQCINTRRVNEVNHIDVSSDYQEFEVNKAHVGTQTIKVRTMILIIKRTNIMVILTPTIATNPVTDTRETTTTVEGTLTLLRMTTLRSQQMFKSPSLDL